MEESKKYKRFDNETSDREYFDWLDNNLNGFVVNPKPYGKIGEYIYHRADCSHIASLTCSYRGKAKVWSPDINGLKDWFKDKKIPTNKARPCAGACSNKNLPASLG
jgi:hypothetical protein